MTTATTMNTATTATAVAAASSLRRNSVEEWPRWWRLVVAPKHYDEVSGCRHVYGRVWLRRKPKTASK